MKDMADKANAIAELFHTPFITLVWRFVIILLLAVSIGAARYYRHDWITSDETVQQLLAEQATTKAAVASHEVFMQQQSISNGKLEAYFKESRDDREKTRQEQEKTATALSTTLATFGAHLDDQKERLDRIERKVDSTSSRQN